MNKDEYRKAFIVLKVSQIIEEFAGSVFSWKVNVFNHSDIFGTYFKVYEITPFWFV